MEMKNNKNEITEKIIGGFLHSPMDSDVQHQFRQWIIAHEDAQEKDDALWEEWDRLSSEESDVCLENERASQLDALHKKLGIRLPRTSKGRKPRMKMLVMGIAAAVIFLGLLGAGFLCLSSRETPERTVMVAPLNDKGEFFLPDGSHVWLNSGARLSYVGGLDSKERRVFLEGEGFFEVKKGNLPFIVNSGDVTSEALGTSFDVRHSPVTGDVDVVLMTGCLKVSGIEKSGEVILYPGQLCTSSGTTGTLSVSNVEAQNYCSWMSPSITFDNRTVKDIITNLEHWYNIKVKVGAGVDLSMRISFTLAPETLDETLNIMEKLTGYKCKILDKNTVWVSLNPSTNK